MSSIIQVLKSIAAIILGYAVIFVFALVFQDLLFGGISYPESPLHHIAIGSLFTAIGGYFGGFLLAITARDRPMIPAFILAGIVIGERAYLHVSGGLTFPLWFDVLASFAVAIGVLLGCQTRTSGISWLRSRKRN